MPNIELQSSEGDDKNISDPAEPDLSSDESGGEDGPKRKSKQISDDEEDKDDLNEGSDHGDTEESDKNISDPAVPDLSYESDGEDGLTKKGKQISDEEDKDDQNEGSDHGDTEESDKNISDPAIKDVSSFESDGEDGPTKKRKRISDDEEDKDEQNEGSDHGDAEEGDKSISDLAIPDLSSDESDGEEGPKKKRKLISDDEEDKDDQNEGSDHGDVEEGDKNISDLAIPDLSSDESDGEDGPKKKRKKISDDEEDKDEEPREESGQADGDDEGNKTNDPAVPDLSTDESDDEDKRRSKVSDDFVYDFDLMMAKKKEESYHRRKRKNIDIINDNDDIIAELVTQMKQSADDDFELNKNRKAATCKLKLLPIVETQLRKIDLREAFLDAGVLGVITDWLTPLPDRSLPNLQVRETMLKLLGEFNIMDVERLKASGIGKAVMYLYKHPKESKENKRRAGVLISSWSRPIFSLDSDFHTMSKEEREQRDFDHMTKLSENKRVRVEPPTTPSSSRKSQPEPEKTLRPGDKGWIPRARVPAPSTRDYVVRPKSNVDSDMTKSGSKKAVTRLDKHLRNFREKKKLMKTQRAVAISIEGRRMSL